MALGFGSNGTVEGVIFEVGVENSDFIAKVDQIQDKAEKVAKAVGGSFTGLIVPVAAAGAAMLATVAAVDGLITIFEKSFKTLDDWTKGIYELSIKTNLSVESLFALKAAGLESEVPIEKLGNSLVFFQKAMVAAKDPTNKLHSLFGELKQNGDDVNSVFATAVERLYNMKAGAERTALATQLFSRNGAAMLQVVDQMGGSLVKTIEKYRDFGLILTPEVVKQNDHLGDSLKDLELRLKGAGVQLASGMVPALDEFVHKLNDAVRGLELMLGGVGKLKDLGKIAIDLVFNVSIVGLSQIPGIGIPLSAVANEGKFIFNYLAKKGHREGDDADSPPKGDDVPDLDKKGKSGPKDLSPVKLAIQLAQEELKELERIYKEETAALDNELKKRIVSEDEYADTQRKREEKLLADKLSVLDKEEAEARTIELPNKQASELGKIEDRRKEARHQFAEAMRKIDQDVITREEQDAAKEAEIQRQVLEADQRYYNAKKKIHFEIRQLELEAEKAEANNLTGTRKTQALANIRAEEENLRYNQALAAIRQEKEDNRNHATNFEQMIAIERQLDHQLEAEKRRHAAVLKEISLDNQRALDREPELGNDSHFLARSILGNSFADGLERTGTKAGGLKNTVDNMTKSIINNMKSLEDIGGEALDGFAKGIGSTVEQYVLLGTTGPAVLKKLLAAQLAHIAAEAAINSVKMLAVGFANLAVFNFAAAEAAFTSAAIWATIGGVAAVAGRAIAPNERDDTSYAGNNGPQTRTINQNTNVAPVQIIVRSEPGTIVETVHGNIKNNGVLYDVVQSVGKRS